jgi:hypothetical protein
MKKPAFEQFGVTKEQCDSIYTRKVKIRDYTFGISSAVGILTGCIAGFYIAQGIYETVVFVLFFGCFLGSLFGAVFTIVSVKVLYTLYLRLFSPDYRNCRKYLDAKSRADAQTEQKIYSKHK